MGKASRRKAARDTPGYKLHDWPGMSPKQLAFISRLERTGQLMQLSESGKLVGVPAPKDADHVRVCSVDSYFADDLTGECNTCGQTVYFRPYGNTEGRLLCAECGIKEFGLPLSTFSRP